MLNSSGYSQNMTDEFVTVVSDTDTPIFAEKGELVAVIIEKPEAGAALTFKDAAGVAIGLVTIADYVGRLPYKIFINGKSTVGLQVTSSGFTIPGRAQVLFRTEI